MRIKQLENTVTQLRNSGADKSKRIAKANEARLRQRIKWVFTGIKV